MLEFPCYDAALADVYTNYTTAHGPCMQLP